MTSDTASRAENTDESGSLVGILEDLADLAEDQGDEVEMNDILHAFEDRSSGALLTLLGLIASLPVVGGIPGISVAVAILVILVVAQRAIGGVGLGLPFGLGRIGVAPDKLKTVVDKARKPCRWIDERTGQRLTALSESDGARMGIFAAVSLLALSMVPLALIPYGVTPPALGIMFFGLALLARDGLLAALGWLAVAGTFATAFWLI